MHNVHGSMWSLTLITFGGKISSIICRFRKKFFLLFVASGKCFFITLFSVIGFFTKAMLVLEVDRFEDWNPGRWANTTPIQSLEPLPPFFHRVGYNFAAVFMPLYIYNNKTGVQYTHALYICLHPTVY